MPASPDPIKAALWFVDHGYKVFPVWGVTDHGACLCPRGAVCSNPGKHPATEHGFKNATADPFLVEKFLANPGTPSYGLVLPPGYIGIDVDGEGKAKWDDLQRTLGPLPVTLTIQTANGFHFIFWWGLDVPPPTHLHGFVVRSTQKGYLIGAGSRHASGAYYDIVRPMREAAALPDAWRTESQAKANGLVGNATIRVGGVQPEDVTKGNRHDFLRDRARTLRGGGLEGEPLYQAVWSLNERLASPKSEEEVRRAIGDVESKFSPDFVRGELRPLKAKALPAQPVGPTEDHEVFDILTSGLVYASQAQPSPDAGVWLVEGLIKPKGIAVLAAPEGIGKSWVRAELAIRLATGTGSLFDVYPVVGKHAVLLLDEENGEDIEYEREEDILPALGLTRADLTSNYARMSFGMTDFETDEGRLAFETRISWMAPAVVIIDTGGVTVGEEHGPEFMRAMRYVRSVTEALNLVVIFVVHLVKPQGDMRDRAAALKVGRALAEVMGHWGRHADSVWQMSDAGDGKVHFNVSKRWGESKNILARDNGLWKAVKVVTPTIMSVKRTNDHRILEALKHLGAAKVQGSPSICEWLGKTPEGSPHFTSVHRRLGVLSASGFVADDGTGLWSLTPEGDTEVVAQAKGFTFIVGRAGAGDD